MSYRHKCVGSVLPFYTHDISVSDDKHLMDTSGEIINDDIHLRALSGSVKQLRIMHINTQSMVSTFDSLLLTQKKACTQAPIPFSENLKKKSENFSSFSFFIFAEN